MNIACINNLDNCLYKQLKCILSNYFLLFNRKNFRFELLGIKIDSISIILQSIKHEYFQSFKRNAKFANQDIPKI